MKRLLSLLLIVITVFGCFSGTIVTVNATDYTTGETGDCTWTFDNVSGELSIKSTNSYNQKLYGYNYGKSPWFSFKDSIKTITVDSNIYSIGDYCFTDCTSLESVYMPGVYEVGDYVFESCEQLKRVELSSKSSGKVGKYAFAYCSSLNKIVLPFQSLTISEKAFYCCDNLETLAIYSSAAIGDNAFSYCQKLTSIYMLNSYIPFQGTVSNNAFSNVSADVYCNYSYSKAFSYWEKSRFGGQFTYKSMTEGIVGYDAFWDYDQQNERLIITGTGKLFRYSSGNDLPWMDTYGNIKCSIKTIIIEDGITEIPAYSFEYMDKVESVALPNTLIRLEPIAFRVCESLTEITLPASLEYVDGERLKYWYRCPNLNDVYYVGTESEWNEIYNWDNNADTRITPHFLVYHPATQTCTKSGYPAHYEFDGTAKDTFYDLNKAAIPTPEAKKLEHSFSEKWDKDANSHWHTCLLCGTEVSDKADHVFDNSCDPICNTCGYMRTIEHQYSADYASDDDSHWRICTVCGEKTDFNSHVWDNGVVTEKATCTKTGIKTYTCSVCNKKKTEEIKATGHTIVTDKAVPASCTETGLTEGSHCSVCNEIIVAQRETPANGHTVVVDKAKECSCTENGLTEGAHCSVCGATLTEQIVIPAAGHVESDPVTENLTATCVESGTYDEVVYCSKCGQEISRETKSAEPLGHHLVFVKQVYPTYSRNGRYAHYECDRCGKLYADATGTHEISEDILTIPMLVEETWAPAPTEAPYPATEPPAPEESTYGDFAYKLYSDGHIEITKYNGNDTTVSVPSEIDGHPVTLIGEKAFYGNTALTEVTIPNSVKFIGSNAFSHCSALETVNLPESIKSLSSGLFSYCTSLKNVTIPSSVTNIGYNAFYHCFSLTDISIPESVTSINSQAFDWCPSLKQVNIPKSVKSIGAKAFGYVCDQKIDGFKILGYENSAAHKYAKANGFDFESTGYIFVPPTEPKPTSPYPEPTEAPIPTEAPEPTEAPIGQIGNYLYDLNTYDNTATLQKYSGKEENDSIPSQQYFNHYDYYYRGYYDITAIGNTAFAGNEYVRSVTIPNTVKTIGDDAFFRCSSLSNVTIPNSVTSIGSWALAQCDNLKSVTIPSSVTSIGDKALGYIDANTKVDGFTITGRTGSAAYKYAVKNGFEFVANDSNISGDVDSDYEVTIMDATAIQAYLAYQRSLNGGEYEPVEKGSRDFTVADVDGDGRISIFDSLRIQRYCVKMCKLDGSPYDA